MKINKVRRSPLFTFFLACEKVEDAAPDFSLQAALGGRDVCLAGDFGLETGDADGTF